MTRNRFFTILAFIFLGLLSRFIPHPPNFTAINAIAIFGATAIGNLPLAMATVFSAMFVSDLAFGLHTNMFCVYCSFGITVILGHFCNTTKSTLSTSKCLIAASLIFFAMTNFGEWLTNPIYSKNLEGFVVCYIAALPFLSWELFGTLAYGAIVFTAFEKVERRFELA